MVLPDVGLQKYEIMFDKIALLNVNLFVTKLQKQGGIR
jgi:hypothetical protein